MTPPPFFIVACDRSGTTMLRLILDGSPEVAIPTESMIVVDFAARAGDPLETDAEFDRLARAVWRHPKVHSYYNNDAGRVTTNMPWKLVDYWRMTHEPALDDFVVTGRGGGG